MSNSFKRGWKYYNHAVIPTTAPHMPVNLEVFCDGSIWNIFEGGGRPLFARWTSEFDCGKETEWWYCIKDTPFDIKTLKAKRRYEITKGTRNFEVRVIDPKEYMDGLFLVQVEAFQAYPLKYRPVIERKSFEEQVSRWRQYTCYAAFERETGEVCGYALLEDFGDWISFQVLKTIPACERKGINAALVSKILEDLNTRLNDGCYICDGERNIIHQTFFQEYLEKYFGFRKAYCRLNIRYRKGVRLAVNVLYPLRGIIRNFKGRLFAKVNAVLFMESIRRSFGAE